MGSDVENKLTRIGVFYDGSYFAHVSNYYRYHHERKARLNLTGIHTFIREEVARNEGTLARYCHIVDAHYFRGRLNAFEAQARDMLFKERQWDDILMQEGIITHYLPLVDGSEKGIDVWFALEAYELAIYKRFNVNVLIAGDKDYVPLVRKLNTLGTRTMVLAWDFRFLDENNQEQETRTAQALIAEVTYPVMMHPLIDDPVRGQEPLINDLFIQRRENLPDAHAAKVRVETGENGSLVQRGTVITLNTGKGFGFVRPNAGGDNLFFHCSALVGAEFSRLQPGDRVVYTVGENEHGACAVSVRADLSAIKI